MTKDKALKMALEALEYCWSDSYNTNGYKARELSNDAITAIKEALAQRTWQGLTDEEVDECYYWKDRQWTTDELVRHVEAKLKEKNT